MNSPYPSNPAARAWHGAFGGVLALLALLASNLLHAQVGYNGFYVGETNTQVTMTATVTDPSYDRMLFAILDTPDTGDAFVGTALVAIPPGGSVRQTLQLGLLPGLRRIGFCLLRTTDTGMCTPVPRTEIGAARIGCVLGLAPANGPAPLTATASARCDVDVGTGGFSLVESSYEWTLPQEFPVPTELPPTPTQTSGTLAAAGSYPVSISPRMVFAPDSQSTAVRTLFVPANRAAFTVTGGAAGGLPNVAITSPSDGAVFTTPLNLQLTASATPGTPGAAINQVEFLVNGQSIGVDTLAPYSATWPTSLGAGSYRLVARATQGGLSADSAPVNIVVAPSAGAAQIRLVNPPNNARILASQEFDLEAEVTPAANGGPIAQVEFFANGSSIGIDTSAPYIIAWPRDAQPGSYLLSARATQDGVSVQSEQVSIDLLPAVAINNQLPTLELTSPSTGSFIDLGTAFNIETAAEDADGEITQVEFLLNGVVIGRRTEAPFTLPAPSGLGVGVYELGAIALDNDGGVAVAAPVSITVRRVPEQLELLTSGPALQIRPGQPSQTAVAVSGSGGGSAGVDLQWQVLGGMGAPVPAGANCTANDSPSSGTVRTGANGEAQIEFLAGCAGSTRTLQINVVGQSALSLSVELPGPNQAVTALSPQISGEIVVASTGEPTPLAITLTSASGAPVANAQVDFSLEPASAGTVTGSALSDSSGVASGILVLNASANQASVQVCLTGRPGNCVLLPIRSLENAVLAPARETLAPIVRSAIEAPRVQMNFLASRMRQLRNSSGHGFSNDVRLNIGELGLPLSGFGNSEAEAGETAEEHDDTASKFGFFVGGDINIAKRGDINVAKRGGLDDRQSGGFRAETRGLTVGMDYRFKPSLVAGLALGMLRTQTDLPADGEQQARGSSASLFGQWLPSDAAYVSGVLHFGRNSYDIERFAGGGQRLEGDTDSRQQAAQFEAGYAFASGPMRFTPFLRYEYIRASTDPILERGGPDALFIDRVELRNTTYSGGLSFDYAISSRSGVWIPGARVEYFGESLDQDEVLARLVTGNIGLRATEIDALDRRYGMAGLSLQWLTAIKGHPISMYFGFDSSFGREDFKTRRYALSIKVPL